MRVPTYNHFLHQSRILDGHYGKITKYQSQISTGKKLLKGSDDPILASRINQVEDSINKIQGYQNNQTIAVNRLSLMQNSLQTSVGTIEKIQELIKTAQTDVSSNADRKNIAKQLSAKLQTLLSQANSRDANGEYAFSGMSSSSSPFTLSNGKYQYNGSYENARIQISDNTNVLFNQVGQGIFGGIKQGNGDFTIRLASSNTGSVEAINGKVANQSSYVEDTYTVSFVTNSGGNIGVTVTGATSGQVIPTPPDTIPGDAPDYVEGGTISFNGVELQLSGTPSAGDSLTIAPSQKDNIFNTIQDLINLLSSDVNTDAEKANLHQMLYEYSDTITSAFQNVLVYQTEVGSTYENTEAQISLNEKSVDNLKFMLGNLGDADLYEVTTALTSETASLELTQKSYVQVQEVMRKLLEYL